MKNAKDMQKNLNVLPVPLKNGVIIIIKLIIIIDFFSWSNDYLLVKDQYSIFKNF